MEKQDDNFQDTDTLVRRRKLKNRLSIAAVVFAAAAVSAVSIGNYMRTRQTASIDETDTFGQYGGQGGLSDVVMASGTTAVGVDAVTFDIDFLEDTSLYVEEVYLSNGDNVQAGDKCIKFTDESITDARAELETTALSASLSYRNGVISNGESKLKAKYTYDAAMLEAQYAQQVYEDTIASLEADYAQAAKTYEDAQEAYNTYFESVQNNSFYEEYDIANLKKAYEEAYDLYVDRKAYWEVTDDELKSTASDSRDMSDLPTLSGAVGKEENVNEQSIEENTDKESTDKENTDDEKAPEESTDEKPTQESTEDEKKPDGEKSPEESNDKNPAQEKNERPGDFGNMGRQQEDQNAQNDRKWIVKTVNLLEQEMEDTKADYENALKAYETEIDTAELKLQKLLNQLEKAREDYTDADVACQKDMLSAKTTYETAAAKGKTAQNDYNTQLASLADSLDRLQDAKEEAESNLALFEKLVGDGYLYTEEAGTVLMFRAEKGQTLVGGSMIFAYSNPKEMSVSVSVSQNDIAKLYVGEEASVMISDYGNYHGIIETINPVSSSDSRTSVAYTVTVRLEGDVSALSPNLTANVLFGNQMFEQRAEETFDNRTVEEKGGRDGQSGRNGKKASDKAD